ncbi:MAG: hypothetical protein A2X84_06940 [Desulfuromonadaceae bacterium GWC2_58_13]|nr:MAG: hypothetical protein A2X84_06940 [Desulfuromonadaceae bacterium GWC2_58_13]
MAGSFDFSSRGLDHLISDDPRQGLPINLPAFPEKAEWREKILMYESILPLSRESLVIVLGSLAIAVYN